MKISGDVERRGLFVVLHGGERMRMRRTGGAMGLAALLALWLAGAVWAVDEQGLPDKAKLSANRMRFDSTTGDFLAEGEVDDFASMRETVLRRYRHVLDKSEPMPQLTLIDGGPIQLEFALKALDELKLELPLIALAEREELVFLPGRPNDPLRLGLDDPVLQLLQRLVDGLVQAV